MRFKTENVTPELVVSKNDSRTVLETVHLNAEASEVWVTDSYMAARFPVDLDEGDTTGPIPLDALKASRKPPLKREATSIRANSHIEVRMSHGETASEPYVTMPRPSGDYQYPSLGNIVADYEGETVSIGLDAEKLAKLAKAMGNGNVRLTLALKDTGEVDPNRPVRVAPLGGYGDGPRGVLMTIRIAS